MKSYIGHLIWIQEEYTNFYVNGGFIHEHTNIPKSFNMVSDKNNTPSKALLDLYWLVGNVGDKDNKNLTNKLRKL